ncbi:MULTISPECIES: SusC/RagA family TonB-linked outer membrane protein [Hymenobacter]|uniref:TonB-dependent receptor n=1 Tax=Hymenobacter profundi TaxID=1982110 RepID=A0ABS6WX27_9BACT|nr:MULTISPECIES: TonB-dependent receptor [Hymenobacter]MBW3128145.1 TonB-dependent receptor [Hymenobacter profundi]QNE39655.1 TonB-dependent receptor [Hymenobacter sp. NBH84]
MHSPLRKTVLGLSLPLFAAVGLPTVSLFLPTAQVMAQASQTVSGQVVGADSNEGIPGVTVLQKGTTNGVSTNSSGEYTLSVPAGSTLVFSAIGYVSQEAVVSGATVNIKLATDTKALDEVVVVGYGTQRAEAVTGSVASISGENLREVPSANISQALQGRLPGVQFSQTSSQPGAATQIRIRGVRSLTASNDPLIVLDGIPFPGSIGDINPNDIQSVDILKDASATAIYGSRGANGVVLVTTKRGKVGQKAQVVYDGFVGAKTLFAKYPMMNGPEFVELRRAAGLYSNPATGAVQYGLDESPDVDTDWQDKLYRTGMQINQNVGISGGTQNGRYNFNAGYYQEEGVIPTQQYTRYTVRGGLDQGVGKYVRLGFTVNNSYSLTEGSNVGIYGTLNSTPIANPYNADGSLKRVISMVADNQWVYTRDVVEANKDRWLSQTRSLASYNSIYGEFKIPGVEGLKYRLNLGVNYRQSQGGSYTGQGIGSDNPTNPSTASVSNSVTTDYTVENLLTYDRTFAGKHNINAVALYSASNNVFNRSQINARDIPSDAFQFYNLGLTTPDLITVNPGDQQYQKFGLLSYMGRVMYSYDDRYLLSATVRSDGSSRLSPGYQWNTYPAVSVGWNVARESFMQDVTAINLLKFRAGYGVTSNQAVLPYATLGLLSTRPYNFGPTNYQTGLFVTQLPNSKLGWEYSKTWNYGVDFAVLNNRLSGTVEYYVTKTENLLLSVGLPPTSGVGSYTANVGSTQNKGIELSLNGVILENLNGWTWEAGVNMYANRNKITALAGERTRDEGNWWFVGKPINVVFDYEKVGLWQQEEPYRDILEPGGAAGMIKVKYTGDYNADGTPTRAIGAADRQILDTNPKFQGGFNTRVAYKGFDLSAVAAFQNGGLLNSTIYGSAGYLNMLTGRRGNVKVDYWTPENTDAKYPNPAGPRSGDNPKYGSTLGYFDASYMKIRTITLGYNFDNISWLQNKGVSRMRFYVTAQNPFVFFSPYKRESGMDPETNSFGDQNAAVPYSGNLSRILTLGTNAPATRTYLAGLNLTF